MICNPLKHFQLTSREFFLLKLLQLPAGGKRSRHSGSSSIREDNDDADATASTFCACNLVLRRVSLNSSFSANNRVSRGCPAPRMQGSSSFARVFRRLDHTIVPIVASMAIVDSGGGCV
jgi:hypothetical protein